MQKVSYITCAVIMAVMVAALLGCQDSWRGDMATPMIQAKPTPSKGAIKTMVIMETSKGTIKIELDADKAPVTVANFLRYVDEKFFDGTIYHRVIPNFMIQGGGFTADMNQKDAHEPIKNEAANGLKNDGGTIAMARTNVVDSATAQFFINVGEGNDFLNYRGASPAEFGYAVFGKVVEGMDVVDAIVAVETTTVGGMQNVPKEAVTIISVRRAEE